MYNTKNKLVLTQVISITKNLVIDSAVRLRESKTAGIIFQPVLYALFFDIDTLKLESPSPNPVTHHGDNELCTLF